VRKRERERKNGEESERRSENKMRTIGGQRGDYRERG
jgi:hypothetical protein